MSLSNASAPGFLIRKHIRLTTDRPYISRTIGAYREALGSIETDYLESTADAVAVSSQKVDIDIKQPSESVNGWLIQNLAEIKSWMVTLWLIKDNAVDADIAWMATYVRGGSVVNNNRWSSTVSKADGSFDKTSFSREDLIHAESVPVITEHWNEGRPLSLDISLARDPAVTKLSSKSPKFERFLYFIDAARTSRDVAIKIAHYCTSLEAIVSSSQTELSHQVAERVACLLYPLGSDRLATFRFVKSAYGIRSKAVHGSPFKTADWVYLKEVSMKIDEICRMIARKYFDEKDVRSAIEGSLNQFNEFWLHRTFEC